MSTNQANPHTHVELAAERAEIRELSLAELQQVSGGLPHRTWSVVGPDLSTAGQGTDPLPHGTW